MLNNNHSIIGIIYIHIFQLILSHYVVYIARYSLTYYVHYKYDPYILHCWPAVKNIS